MDLLEDLKISLLNFSFLMIYITPKMLVFFKNHLNYLKDNIFECIFKKYYRLSFFNKKNVFSQNIMMENPKSEEGKIIKDIRNLFRLKKELNDTAT